MMGELTVILFVFFVADVFYPLRAIREFPATADCLDGIPIDTAFALLHYGFSVTR